jgi:hypothetical protein
MDIVVGAAVLVVVVFVVVKNRTLVDVGGTNRRVRKKEKGKEKDENNIRKNERDRERERERRRRKKKEEEKGTENRLTLGLCIRILSCLHHGQRLIVFITFVHFVRNESRSENISVWKSF